MAVTTDLLRHVPEGATHCVIEERLHRGQSMWAVVAIVPNGASIPLNSYTSKELAESTAQGMNDYLDTVEILSSDYYA